MKYTIELTNKQKDQMDCIMEIVHRYVGFNPKLEPVEYSSESEVEKYGIQAYNKGFEDGKKWAIDENAKDHQGYYDNGYNNALKDVNHAMDVLKGMTGTECAEWFENYVGVDDVVCTFTIQRIMESTKAYEKKKKEEIKVGDEVTVTDSDALVGYTFIVM